MPEGRSDSQRGKDSEGEKCGRNRFGLTLARETQTKSAIDPERVEGIHPLDVVEILGWGDLAAGRTLPGIPHPHHPVGGGVGERPEQDAVDDGEDGRVCADAQR